MATANPRSPLRPAPNAPQVHYGWFEPLRHPKAQMAVVAVGAHLHIGDAPLFARVGTQPVSNIQPIQGGRGFTGTLALVPHDGDRLYFKYLGTLESGTQVVYHGEAPNVA
jgi:hypothetical protein